MRSCTDILSVRPAGILPAFHSCADAGKMPAIPTGGTRCATLVPPHRTLARKPNSHFPRSRMNGRNPPQLFDISREFQIHGEILHAEPCKVGHINETYTATYDQGGTQVRYIHQRINHNVFKDPAGVMDNLLRVTRHLRRKLAENG